MRLNELFCYIRIEILSESANVHVMYPLTSSIHSGKELSAVNLLVTGILLKVGNICKIYGNVLKALIIREHYQISKYSKLLGGVDN